MIVVSLGTLVSCKKEEGIHTPKEFSTGDIVTYNGILYEYLDIDKDIPTSNYIPLIGEKAIEYVFEEEENYKSYYHYYLDMSDYKNQPKLRDDKTILESGPYFMKLNSHNIENSPIDPYAFSVLSHLDNIPLYPDITKGSFIVKGYTEELPEEVEIPEKIHGKYVTQIGFRAFENAPMKSLKTIKVAYVHPYAFQKCPNLIELEFNNWEKKPGSIPSTALMSMAISDCENIKQVKGGHPSMDCCYYNLPHLEVLEDAFPYYCYESIYPGRMNYYGLGGIRKSFFYNCPRLREITGRADTSNIPKLNTIGNVVYYDTKSGGYVVPIYVYDNYTAIIEDLIFTYTAKRTGGFTVMYNPETYEAYVPFLNDGLEKEGEILFRHREQGPEAVTEDETGIYINAMYYESKYNAKLLFKRK